LIDVLANLRNGLIIARWLNVYDEACLVGCASNPPIRESRIGEGEQKDGYQ
jgi:hypothetical protein